MRSDWQGIKCFDERNVLIIDSGAEVFDFPPRCNEYKEF